MHIATYEKTQPSGRFIKKSHDQKWSVLPVLGSLLFVIGSISANTYTVTNNNSSGSGSLHWAIDQANSNPGADSIVFNHHYTISLYGRDDALPHLTDNKTVITAVSQWIGTWPNGSPGDTIDGNGNNFFGIVIDGADSCKIEGLFIHSFDGIGINIIGNAIGNTIGGTGTGQRNVICNNDYHWNYDNTAGWEAIQIGNSSTSSSPQYNKIKGNYLGVRADGVTAWGNWEGVELMNCQYDTVGGTDTLARNIISGNTSAGIEFDINGAYNQVLGNYIGVAKDGITAVSDSNGIRAIQGAHHNTIGGTAAGSRNIIAGNIRFGIYIASEDFNDTDPYHNIIEGNFIGLNKNGAAVANGDGIHIRYYNSGSNSGYNVIGGTTSASRNVISGNSGDGVSIDNYANGNVVLNNYIGTDTLGTVNRGNGGTGVWIDSSASYDTVGTVGQGNIIAFNGGKGISLVETRTSNPTHYNRFSANSFFSNGGLAIDLSNNGVTSDNGSESDSLPNYGIDFPMFDTAKLRHDTLHVAGYVGTSRSSAGSSGTFGGDRIEIYKSAVDPTGYGEGKIYLGFLTTGTSNSLFSGDIVIAGKGFYGSDSITGITIDPSGNTSEFGLDDPVLYPTSVVIASFSAAADTDQVTVSWKTANEVDVAGFNLYRSPDGSGAYQKLNPALIPIHGDPLTGGSYEFSDSAGVASDYYKLEVVNLSGGSTFHGPIQPTTAGSSEGSNRILTRLSAFPNPTRSSVHVQYSIATQNHVRLAVYNTLGQMVERLVDSVVHSGTYQVVWNAQALPSGVYFITLDCGGVKCIQRIVTLK